MVMCIAFLDCKNIGGRYIESCSKVYRAYWESRIFTKEFSDNGLISFDITIAMHGNDLTS